MTIEPRIRPGQVYAARDEGSRYQVLKVLHADEEVVVARRYVNLFDELPAGVPAELRLDLTLEELESGQIGIGWGAIAIDAAGFAEDAREFTLLDEEPVTDEERENVEDAMNPPAEREGLWARLGRLLRRSD